MTLASVQHRRLSDGQLHRLRRFSTPTIYNGWEQITAHDPVRTGINREPLTDFTPQLGPVVGYAATVVIEPSNPAHREAAPDAWHAFRHYLASEPGPKIVVVQDLDKPETTGAFWGEVNATISRALGCVGAITDGGVRDIAEVNAAGFKLLARRLCVGHAHVHPVRWDTPVEVFGTTIQPGQLIHADAHGFLAIPEGEERDLLAATARMDEIECTTVIEAGRHAMHQNRDDALQTIESAGDEFARLVRESFNRRGEF